MEITWLGHSCFRIKAREGVIVTDPFDKTSGYQLGKVTANIVTISHDHPQHNFASGVGGEPKIIRSLGEYEIAGMFIYGIKAFHDANKGQSKGKNIIYFMEAEDIKLCHLGDLGHALSAAQIEEVSDTDILMVPVGGFSTINASAAAEVVNAVQPRIVIPMHYKTPAIQRDLEPLDKFLKEMGVKEASPLPKLVINKATLPIDTQVMVLDYKQ